MTALAELLRRVEAATGPDRELDCLVWIWADDRTARYSKHKLLARSNHPPHDECVVGLVYPNAKARNFFTAGQSPPIPKFSDSIDAALALVERQLPGAAIRMGTDEGPCWACINGLEEQSGEAPTLSRAILAALLKALIAQRGEG